MLDTLPHSLVWKAKAASFAVLVLATLATMYVRHISIGDPWFWDATVFATAGERMAAGLDPYQTAIPFARDGEPLPFITAPPVASLLAAGSAALGPGLLWLLVGLHVAAFAITPLILSRLYLGRSAWDVAFGYAVFVGGMGALGVTAFATGNFGTVINCALVAALAHGLRRQSWTWFHVIVAAACIVKPPYALFWIIPVLVAGWNWREVFRALLGAALAASVFLISYLGQPEVFHDWVASLVGQVAKGGDYGFSVYGQMVLRQELSGTGDPLTPVLIHSGVMAALLAFLMLSKVRGDTKAAALFVFAILANPRLKEYEIAFTAIPVAGLMLRAFASEQASQARRALAVLAVSGLYVLLIRADQLPILGPYVYVLLMAGAVLSIGLRGEATAAESMSQAPHPDSLKASTTAAVQA